MAVLAVAVGVAVVPMAPTTEVLILGAILASAQALPALAGRRGSWMARDLVGVIALAAIPLVHGVPSLLWILALPVAALAPLSPLARAWTSLAVVATAASAALAAIAVGESSGAAALIALAPAGIGLAVGAAADTLTTRSADLEASLGAVRDELDEQRAIEAELRRERSALERGGEDRLIALQAANRALERENQERRLAEEQALEAIRTKVAFLANVSHELRTPLNAVIGLTEILAEDARSRGDAQNLNDQQAVLSAAHHLLAIIDDVLDLTKIEAGKVDTHPEVFQVDELLESLGKDTLPLARKNNNTLKLKYGRDLGYVKTDRSKLRRILMSLLANACKFTRDGRIELRVDAEVIDERRYFLFSVSDTGVGIGHDTLGRLFKPFTQADDSSTRPFGGLGLGLAIARHYAERLGGEINVESKVGQGSTFRLRVPVEPEDPRAAGHLLVSMY